MHNRIDLIRMVVEAEKGIQRLAEVGQVDLHGTLVCARRGCAVEHQHVIAVLGEVLNASAAQLAVAACHENLRHAYPPGDCLMRSVPHPLERNTALDFVSLGGISTTAR
jgi:hypothetical protein